MKDKSFRMQDETGNIIELTIDGSNVIFLMEDGFTYDDAVQATMDTAFFNAVHNGLIKEDAWIIEV